MARPEKRSLDYFPLEVGFFNDDKIALVGEQFGLAGELVAVKLLARLYETDGYFLRWDDDRAALFSLRVMFRKVSTDEVIAIVDELLARNFFDRDQYKRNGILTSRAIQEQWLDIQKKCRHGKAKIQPEFSLIDELKGGFSRNRGVSSEETPVFAEKTPANKIKEKKSKAKALLPPLYPPPPGEAGAAVMSDSVANDCPGLFEGIPPAAASRLLDYSEQVCAAWNETFHGTEREVVAVNQPLKQHYRAALIDANNEGITLDQFRRAFVVLRDTPRLSWQLHSAIKPDNVRMLLTEGENARQVRAVARSGPVIPVHSQTEYATEGEFWGR